MYNTLVAILTWLAGDPAQIDILHPRAAVCSQIAYSTCVRESIKDDTLVEGEQPGDSTCDCEAGCEGECDGKCCDNCKCEVKEPEVQPEEGTPTAQVKTKRRVVRCVNGRCVITYE